MKRAMAMALVMGVWACGSTSSSGGTSDGGGDGSTGDAARGDGSTGCHADAECDHTRFETCARVEDPQCGGIRPQPQCASDPDCADAGASMICVTDSCSGAQCLARCTSDASCVSNPPGLLACSTASGRCGAKPCAQPSDCPANFTCGSTSVCQTKTCTTDADCSGACVNRLCSSQIGMCRQPAA